MSRMMRKNCKNSCNSSLILATSFGEFHLCIEYAMSFFVQKYALVKMIAALISLLCDISIKEFTYDHKSKRKTHRISLGV